MHDVPDLYSVWVCEGSLIYSTFVRSCTNVYKWYNFEISMFWYSVWVGWYVDLFQIGYLSQWKRSTRGSDYHKSDCRIVRLPQYCRIVRWSDYHQIVQSNCDFISKTGWKQTQLFNRLGSPIPKNQPSHISPFCILLHQSFKSFQLAARDKSFHILEMDIFNI